MVFLKVLRMRHLAILWLSQVLSAIGDYFHQIAVIWLAIKVAGSGAGLVAATGAGSMLLFSLLGGVYADRWNRRITMIAVDVLRALIVAMLPILMLFGILQLWHLIVVEIVVDGAGALFNPALQASLPALAGDAQALQATNGLMDVTRRLARALGPSLVGVLIIWIPLLHFFTLDAISFLISASAVFSLGRHFAWKPMRKEQVARGIKGIVTEIIGAIRLIQTRRPLAWAFVLMGIVSLAWSAAFTIGVPLLAARVLQANISAYGLIVGSYGVGNVLSNLVIGSLVIRRKLLMLFSGKIVVGAGFLLLAFAPHLSIALLGSAFAAIGGPMGDLVLVTMIQTALPSEQIGKVYSLLMLVESAGISLGLLLAVPLFKFLSVPIAIALCALVIITSGAVGLIRFGVQESAHAVVQS
jgi:DHA3 family macrolide efflux protein-like MFS transporter